MKKNIFVFSFCFLLLSIAQAQLWSRVVGTNTHDEDFKSVCRAESGDFLIASNRALTSTGVNNANDRNILITLMGTNGNILWEKEYGTKTVHQRVVKVLEVAANEFIVVGHTNTTNSLANYSTLVMRIDGQGNVLWQKNYSITGGQIPNDAILLGNGNIAITGVHFDSGYDGFAHVINPTNGSIIWYKSYAVTNDNWFHGLTQAANGDIVVYGAMWGDLFDDTYLRLNPANGNILSQRRKSTTETPNIRNSGFADAVALADNGILFLSTLRQSGVVSGANFSTTNYVLTRVSANNQVLWSRSYNSGTLTTPVNDEGVYLMLSQNQDTAYVLGFTNITDPTTTNIDPTITCISLNNQLPVWGKRIIAQDAAFNNNTNYIPTADFLFDGDRVLQFFTTRANPFQGEQPLGQNLYVASSTLSSELRGCNDNTYTVTSVSIDTTLFTPSYTTGSPLASSSNLSLNPLTNNPSVNPICGYIVQEGTLQCGGDSTFCVPLVSVGNVPNGIIGMDFCMSYDVTKVQPTGNVTIGSVVLNGNNPNIADYTINTQFTNTGELRVSIFYMGSGNYEFTGSGDICCVEFEMLPAFTAPSSACFSICELIESYDDHITHSVATQGCYTLVNDSLLEGRIIFWDDNVRPISNSTPATNIRGVNATCASPSATVANPNANGWFSYDIANGASIQIQREIGATPVMNTINGMDCHFTSLVTTHNNTYFPNAYQMIAMDVNIDGAVSAGDITLMRNRILQLSNNYNSAGVEWRFVDDQTVMSNPSYQISTTYPSDDNQGYSYLNVPFVPNCMEVPTISTENCTYIDSMEYHAVLLGDVNGDWQASSNLRIAQDASVETMTNDKVLFDLTLATVNTNECVINIPVRYESENPMLALDFEMDYDEGNIDIDDVYVDGNFANANLMMQYHDLQTEKLLLTSYINGSTSGIVTQNPVLWISVKSDNGSITEVVNTILGNLTAYFNGKPAEVSVIGNTVNCTESTTTNQTSLVASRVVIYPQPTQDLLYIEYPKEVSALALYNLEGKKLQEIPVNPSGKTELDMSKYVRGFYFLQINGQTTRKIVK